MIWDYNNISCPECGGAAWDYYNPTKPCPVCRERLTDAQRDLLWTIAQHKYGWVSCPNVGRRVRHLQTALALERRGLVTVDRVYASIPTCSATEKGRRAIERRFPVSPFALGTYAHQPGGWTPREGV